MDLLLIIEAIIVVLGLSILIYLAYKLKKTNEAIDFFFLNRKFSGIRTDSGEEKIIYFGTRKPLDKRFLPKGTYSHEFLQQLRNIGKEP